MLAIVIGIILAVIEPVVVSAWLAWTGWHEKEGLNGKTIFYNARSE